MPFKDSEKRMEYEESRKESRREYFRQYYEKNKERIKERNAAYYERTKHEQCIANGKRYYDAKNACDELHGNVCVGCQVSSDERRLMYHEIHGNDHIRGRSQWKYILEHPDDFVRLCTSCHASIHKVAKRPELFELVNKILKETVKIGIMAE